MTRKQFVHCPTCRRSVAWNPELSPWRPFCSERCKMTDLGAWFSEENTIPGVELPEELIEEFREDGTGTDRREE